MKDTELCNWWFISKNAASQTQNVGFLSFHKKPVQVPESFNKTELTKRTIRETKSFSLKLKN